MEHGLIPVRSHLSISLIAGFGNGGVHSVIVAELHEIGAWGGGSLRTGDIDLPGGQDVIQVILKPLAADAGAAAHVYPGFLAGGLLHAVAGHIGAGLGRYIRDHVHAHGPNLRQKLASIIGETIGHFDQAAILEFAVEEDRVEVGAAIGLSIFSASEEANIGT